MLRTLCEPNAEVTIDSFSSMIRVSTSKFRSLSGFWRKTGQAQPFWRDFIFSKSQYAPLTKRTANPVPQLEKSALYSHAKSQSDIHHTIKKQKETNDK